MYRSLPLSVLALFLFVGSLQAEELSVQLTLLNHAHQPVGNAACVLNTSDGQTLSAVSDTLGQVTFEVSYTSAVIWESSDTEQDDLNGPVAMLHSTQGEMRVYNILGKEVEHRHLQWGLNRFQPDMHLPSGKYFIKMTTPVYQAVASVMVINGRIAGQGKTVTLEQRAQSGGTAKGSADVFELQASAPGYSDLTVAFDPHTQLTSHADELYMNMIPHLAYSLPDTLWHGFDWNLFVMNDDSGLWQWDNDEVDIAEGLVSLNAGSPQISSPVSFSYTDSADAELGFDYVAPVVQNTLRPRALLAVVENVFFYSYELELAYTFLRSAVAPIFANLFEVPVSSLDGLSLDEVIDIYGEAWQLNTMEAHAQGYYQRFIGLSDEGATAEAFMDSLAMLHDMGFEVDVVFNLHGSHSSVLFSDDSIDIDDLTGAIQQRGCVPRTLYQTCCYGLYMADEWESIGVEAVSGARSFNGMAIFSPMHFVYYFTRGLNFQDAVQRAYEEEINSITTYDSEIPVSEYLLTEDVLLESIQETAGLNPLRHWF